MSIINKSLSGFIFNGPALALALAAWKGKVRVIYGFNAGGTGYTSFKPTSQFNSLTQLVQDGVYIIDAAATGFDIPGATLTASVPGSNPALFFNVPEMRRVPGPNNDVDCTVEFGIESTDPDDKFAMIFVYDSVYGFDYSFSPVAIDPNNLYSINFTRPKGTGITLFATSNNGSTAYKGFAV